MLPDAQGIPYQGIWAQGNRIDFTVGWELENVYDLNQLGVVVFVQNPVSKEIYQAAYLEKDLLNSRETPVSSDSEVNIWPIPAQDYIQVFSPSEKINSLSLVNLLGQTLWSQEVDTFRFSVPVHAVGTGVYLLRLSLADGRILTRRIQVKRP